MTLLLFALLLLPGSLIHLAASEIERFKELNRRVYITSDEMKTGRRLDARREEVPGIVEELRKIITSGTLSLLRKGGAAGDQQDVAQQIVRYIHELQGPSLELQKTARTNTPMVVQSVVHGFAVIGVSTCIVTDNEHFPNTVPRVDFYSKARGTWEYRATAGAEFDDRSFHVKPVSPPDGDGLYLLAWGWRFFDTGQRLRVVMYNFDGESARSVAMLDELTSGMVREVTGESITVFTVRRYTPGEERFMRTKKFVFRANGFEQVSETVIDLATN